MARQPRRVNPDVRCVCSQKYSKFQIRRMDQTAKQLGHAQGRPAHDRVRASAGFTLVELIVTIAVAAILITVAVPSFKHMIESNRLSTTANNLVSALRTAQMEAIKRNTSTQFCGDGGNGGDTLGAACNDDPGAVYALAQGGGVTQILAAPPEASAGSLQLTIKQATRFNGQGVGHLVSNSAPRNGSIAKICSTAISSNNVRTIEMVTGSAIHITDQGACP